MRLLYLNPNSSIAMTDQIVAAAREALPEAEILGWTNASGPPAIEGAEDGERAIAGLRAMLPEARARCVDLIVIACFDDTGLEELRALAHCPVIGIGQAAYVLAMLAFGAFSVVTSLPVSVPVLEGNIERYGFDASCVSVRASGLPVLTVEAGGPQVIERLSDEIVAAGQDGGRAVALGCAGMAHLRPELAARSAVPLIDGVAASAHLARAIVSNLA